MVRESYERHPDASSPFEQLPNGGGPSTSSWTAAHLEWLHTEVKDDCPLFDSDAVDAPSIFPELDRIHVPTHYSVHHASVGSRLHQAVAASFGTEWEDVLFRSEAHYRYLVELSNPRPNIAATFFDQSSPPSILPSSPPVLQPYGGSDLPGPFPQTPCKQPYSRLPGTPPVALTNTHTPAPRKRGGADLVQTPSSRSSKASRLLTAIESIESPLHRHTAAVGPVATPAEGSPKSPAFVPFESTVDDRAAHSADDLRGLLMSNESEKTINRPEGARTPGVQTPIGNQSGSPTFNQDGFSSGSDSGSFVTCLTSIGPEHTPIALIRLEPPSTYRSRSSDATYIPSSHPGSADTHSELELSNDREESIVQAAARECLRVLAGIVEELALDNTELTVYGHEAPPSLRTIIEGLICSSKPDLAFVLLNKSKAWKEGKYGIAIGEVKRLDHNLHESQILGQEVGELLCMAAISNHNRDTDDERIIQSYMFSWHHLKGYITRLDVVRSRLESIALGEVDEDSCDHSESPLRVYRSRIFDLNDADDRVEFLVGIVAIALVGMRKYSRYRPLVRSALEKA